MSCPRQSGNQPILNIDPQTGHLYVEDDSNYRLKQYGTVYRVDQEGKVLKKWPPVFFNNLGLKATSPWWTLDYERHFRYPDEPLFIDSIFGKDGRVYRWKLGKAGWKSCVSTARGSRFRSRPRGRMPCSSITRCR